MMVQLATPATSLETWLVSSTSPFLSPPWQHPTSYESYRFYHLNMTWISVPIHFTPNFRDSDGLIHHLALQELKGFPGHGTFSFFKNRTVLGKLGQVGHCSLISSSSLPGILCIHYTFSQLEYLLLINLPTASLTCSSSSSTLQLLNCSIKNPGLKTWLPYLKLFLSFPCLQEVIQPCAHTRPSMTQLLPGILVPTPSLSFKAHISIRFHWPFIWFRCPFLYPIAPCTFFHHSNHHLFFLMICLPLL